MTTLNNQYHSYKNLYAWNILSFLAFQNATAPPQCLDPVSKTYNVVNGMCHFIISVFKAALNLYDPLYVFKITFKQLSLGS